MLSIAIFNISSLTVIFCRSASCNSSCSMIIRSRICCCIALSGGGCTFCSRISDLAWLTRRSSSRWVMTSLLTTATIWSASRSCCAVGLAVVAAVDVDLAPAGACLLAFWLLAGWLEAVCAPTLMEAVARIANKRDADHFVSTGSRYIYSYLSNLLTFGMGGVMFS